MGNDITYPASARPRISDKKHKHWTFHIKAPRSSAYETAKFYEYDFTNRDIIDFGSQYRGTSMHLIAKLRYHSDEIPEEYIIYPRSTKRLTEAVKLEWVIEVLNVDNQEGVLILIDFLRQSKFYKLVYTKEDELGVQAVYVGKRGVMQSQFTPAYVKLGKVCDATSYHGGAMTEKSELEPEECSNVANSDDEEPYIAGGTPWDDYSALSESETGRGVKSDPGIPSSKKRSNQRK